MLRIGRMRGGLWYSGHLDHPAEMVVPGRESGYDQGLQEPSVATRGGSDDLWTNLVPLRVKVHTAPMENYVKGP